MPMMEHANIPVDSGPQDQSEQDFVLDFESNVDNVEDGPDAFDFVLDGAYDQAEHNLVGDVAEGASAPDPDSGLSLAHDGAHATGTSDKPSQGVEAAEIIGNSAEAETDYQEEIGYEDDEFVATKLNADLIGSAEAVEAGAIQAEIAETEVIEAENVSPNAMFEGGLDYAQLNDDAHAEVPPQGGDASWQEEISFEVQGDDGDAEELDETGEEDTARHAEENKLAVDDSVDETMHKQSVADHGENDLDKALEDLTHSLAEAPDIEVLYSEEYFSLFGTSDDDPDSYFLSDVEELDRPLSHFLAAVRAVISDDIAPADELLIRFDPLGLEFGERSNEKFLSRTFREVFGCYSTLRQRHGTSSDPVIHLTVRKDSEEHFLELLAEAEGVKASPDGSGDSEMSEHDDEELANPSPNGAEFQDELFEDQHLNDYHREDENGGTATTDDHGPAHHVQEEDQNEPESAQVPDNGPAEQEQDVRIGASAPHPPNPISEDLGGEDEEDLGGEVDLEEGSADAHPSEQERSENEVNDEQTWDGQTGEDDDATGPQQAETPFEILDEATHQLSHQDVEESIEPAGFGGATAPENGTDELEAGANDDDFILAFNDDAGLPAVHEEHADDDRYGEYMGTYDSSDLVADDVEDNQEPDTVTDAHNTEGAHDAEDAHDSEDAHDNEDARDNEAFPDEDQIDTAVETASIHTSTTVGGDEVDYQGQNAAGDDVAQSAAASGVDNDEIDWENDEDEDEDEQQPTTREETVEAEELQEATLSPPSAAGKRSRTDEAESLAEETDHKRRRT